jgi:hypothetical protein
MRNILPINLKDSLGLGSVRKSQAYGEAKMSL